MLFYCRYNFNFLNVSHLTNVCVPLQNCIVSHLYFITNVYLLSMLSKLCVCKIFHAYVFLKCFDISSAHNTGGVKNIGRVSIFHIACNLTCRMPNLHFYPESGSKHRISVCVYICAFGNDLILIMRDVTGAQLIREHWYVRPRRDMWREGQGYLK